ncbi:hypothetical protein IL306_001995 [Fusarium sp. DS 682]|nr:hypothetical protein IL306_001995 [Fusarium sp. DS 682]
MEPDEDSLMRLCRLIRSFQLENIPSDLFIRACEPRPTWSSTGEIVQRQPLEAGVPEWLVSFYNANKPFFQDPDMKTRNGGVELILENGVTFFKVTNDGQPDPELDQDLSITEESGMAQERIAIVLQAYPSINAEVIGEEMIDRLMGTAKSSVLPLLSSLTDTDIKDWLLPQNLEELVQYAEVS